MHGIARLKNRIQEYTWGSRTAIAEFLGKPAPSPVPQAEVWMGAHPKSPSDVVVDGVSTSLIDVIRKDPEGVLGVETAQRFSGELPFLFKVLAAASPLSIQAHPNIEQAREGYKRENREKIPLDSYERSYKDRNHKPEIISALTPFWTMSGFRPVPQILEFLGWIGFKSIAKEIKGLEKSTNGEGLKEFFHSLLTLPEDRKEDAIGEVLSWARSNLDATQNRYRPVCRWTIEINSRYPRDIGVLSPILLNLVCLNPGEAMFTPAGVLHAYLDGVGIELMANSDNVLRGGLTGKYIDVPELLKVLTYIPRSYEPVVEICRSGGEVEYDSPAQEFKLSRIRLKENSRYESAEERSVEIILCTDGGCTISENTRSCSIDMHKGDSILVPSYVPGYSIQGSAVLFKASVPLFPPAPSL